MELTTALEYLHGHVNREATAGRIEGLSLDRIRAVLAALGDPQRDVPVVHVTGTNGKGSTVRMVAALLQALGLSVGSYTSPHLERLNERLRWDGRPVDDETLAELLADVARVEPLLEAAVGPPSYFEILTAAAYKWFADVAVDVAVVEVGLLGRYDATNAGDGAVAVITNVGLDHTDGGPGWRAAIAEEKAGIVKPGATLVLGETDPDLAPIFAAAGAGEVWRRDEDFGCLANQLAIGGRLIDVRTPGATYDQLFLPLHGAHQGDNAAIALAATEAFVGRPLDEDVVTEALAGVVVPGRFEVVGHQPLVVLDGAHNPDGASSLAATLTEGFASAGRRHFVLGFLDGRDAVEMLRALGVGADDELVVCTPDSPRAQPASVVVEAAATLGLRGRRIETVAHALDEVLGRAGPDDVVVVAGSLYVVGAARSWCRARGLVAERD
ncbi:MAG: hypothetical protein JNK12_21745 [Acidimicrobiales bacterium]|nr:hypothetical protein [Acidimicrobiales bacterium]